MYRDQTAKFALDYPTAWFLEDNAAQDAAGTAIYTVSLFSWDRMTYTPLPKDLNTLPDGAIKIDITVFNEKLRSLEEAVRLYANQDSGTPVTILKQESWTLESGEQAMYIESQGALGKVGTMITLVSDRVIYLSGYGNLRLFKPIALTLRADTGRSVTNPTPVPTEIPVNVSCTDSAAFVSDVTIPDNSILTSNMAFTETWRLKNRGSCTWDNTYLVAYISGATMSQQPGYWILPHGQTVAPGQTVDVSVGMTSPVENGNYASYWGLKKVDGQFMPIQGGANGDSFFVKIKVSKGITPGNVTAASIDIEPEQGSGPACTADSTYFVHASITTNGPTTVTYEIDSTAGQTTAGYFQSSTGSEPSLSIPGTLVFDQADTKTINLRFVGPYPYPDNITMLLWVNRSDWYQAKLDCQ
ncbi:MAG TPA: NBR1-Ig-like domain-containing protein, partial [Anaerolineales bacterium]|nr:NBR1-Ig-like domain-containing protein [Anaerolineales bacterium]